jgi:TetR/AcrR family transcriptional repressor of bet genes
MPVLVDRQSTRSQIAQIALNIIADEGLDGLTVRRVAQVAGTSTAIVSTYFDGKRDLTLTAFNLVRDRQKVHAAQAERDGLGLRGVVEAYLPVDEQRLKDWRVVFAFYGMALFDPELFQFHSERIDGATRRFERILMQELGTSRRTAAITKEAERIVNGILGVAARCAFQVSLSLSPAGRSRLVSQVLNGPWV